MIDARTLIEGELADLIRRVQDLDAERRAIMAARGALLRILRALTTGLPPEPTEPAPALRLVTEFDLEPEQVTEERFAAMGDGSIVVPGAPGADKVDLDSVLDRLEAEGR